MTRLSPHRADDAERKRMTEMIPNVRQEIVSSGGHFLVLDQPEQVVRFIEDFSAGKERYCFQLLHTSSHRHQG